MLQYFCLWLLRILALDQSVGETNKLTITHDKQGKKVLSMDYQSQPSTQATDGF